MREQGMNMEESPDLHKPMDEIVEEEEGKK